MLTNCEQFVNNSSLTPEANSSLTPDAMILVKLRLRGLGEIPETDWIEAGPGLNVVQVRTAAQQTALIEAVATLNPPYRCREVEPFADLPRQITRRGYTRRVVPHKRTIAIGVFNSEPGLVQELAEISPILYETDLIEVGRRLDYSRWVNFIELASSTRWGDIAAEVDDLLATPGLVFGNLEHLRRRLDTLTPTDRIKGEIMADLAACLEAAAAGATPGDRDRLTGLLHRVLRARHFAAARKVVKKRLPLLAALDLDRLPSWRFGSLHPGRESCLPPALTLLLETCKSTVQNADAAAAQQLLQRLQQELSRAGATPAVVVQRQQQQLRVGVTAANGRLQLIDELAPGDRLAACCRLLSALSTVLLESPPILLFSLPNRENSDDDRAALAGRITELTGFDQWFCVTTDTHLFPEQAVIPVGDQARP